MTREAKFNLWFLLAFLLISLPGLVILVRKKMQPDARSMAEASYVRPSDTYNNPLPTRSKGVRTVPPQTFAWVEDLAAEHLGHPPLRHVAAGGRREPVMSRQRRFELLDVQERDGHPVVILLAWQPDFGAQRVNSLHASAPGLGSLAETHIQPVAVPGHVIDELKDEGFVLPPARTAVVWLHFKGTTPTEATAPATLPAIELAWSTPEGSFEDVLELSGWLLERAAGAKSQQENQDRE